MKPPLRQGSSNDFQTPPEALRPLLPYLKKDWHIWECASGKGNLVAELLNRGYVVSQTDILPETESRGHIDFTEFTIEKYPTFGFDCIITNPPFKYKQEFLEKCYSLGKPFALLLPLTTFETQKRQKLFDKYGLEVIFLPRRINFETPSGKGSGSWFATAWFTNWLNVGKQFVFYRDGQKSLIN